MGGGSHQFVRSFCTFKMLEGVLVVGTGFETSKETAEHSA